MKTCQWFCCLVLLVGCARPTPQAKGTAAIKKLQAVLAERWLVWEWSENESNRSADVVFLIQRNDTLTGMKTNWPIVGTIPATALHQYPIYLDQTKASLFYFVQASNTITRQTSE